MSTLNSAVKRLASRIPESELVDIAFNWPIWAMPHQLPPDGDWTTWLLLGGRGAGKTRAGAQWVLMLAELGISPIALVGETMTEAEAVMVKGESGVLRICPPWMVPKLTGSVLHWPNGVEAHILPASDPERFRGPQFAAAWCDETGKWKKAEAAFDMLQFGLRLGPRPRQLVTTTPRATKLMKRLIADERTVITRAATKVNNHLAEAFLAAVVERYRDTVLGRQELDGELIEDRPDALWQRSMFRPPDGAVDGRIVVAVDPPVTGTERSDACGIVVAGRAGEGAVVLEDATVQGVRPDIWAARAVAAFRAHEADCIVVEVNQGGDLVEQMLKQVDASVPVRMVRANRGKWVRAEPVAALYARGLVCHVAGLHALEDELCAFGPDGKADGHSPDRVDALVWALTELVLNDVRPRVRGL
ncbi:terminase family protein [Devosia sp. XJ19-1]|uniref:Terminase family protein n=1 Tax=Devosia ureilytica TaxID=2952754 RepID=A0A9Q4AQK6_9HYPH|nr:terminase family protein [Devosia ureilytica]MCP8884260.1 terminase family protein [Devosia ureilytica]MCP8887868.1 terminase family protein [Devosia ureilytica]